tara:strand:+ start:113 stop:307 length:195 start_codon:yes stop_codon:yes gene_type:complete
MIGFATWVIGMNTKKGVSMNENTAKVHEAVSKVTITDKAKPEIVQGILSWVIDTVTNIVYKKKF